MFSYFTAEHDAFRRTVRRFVETEINPHVEEWEAARLWPAHELLKKMGDLGLLGLGYPEEYGGGGVDYWYNTVLLEELGRADCAAVPMGIAVHTDMATPALAEFGSDELKRRFLAPAIAGDMVAAIGVSEPDAGSDVAAIRTRATADGDDYVINGAKMWITNGAQADFVTLLVRTGGERGFRGMSLIVVPTATPGFHVSRTLEKMGNHASDTAILTFEDVRVPQANRIGAEGMGFILQMKQFQKERLAGSLMSTVGMEKMIRLTIDYTRGRQAFGRPLIDNQWIHFRLAELLTEVEALRQLNYHCVRLLIAGEDLTKEVSMAKLKAGRLAREVADTCVQFHGGMGYVEEYPMARYFRDARLLSIGGGADEIMLGIIAKYENILPKG
ncbi:Acyl-CoA dehydrogenase domain protein [Candidatus Promineifilum breve]|uniref:Acyl-CoA dehydrogenase domain protein n=1 Tax=Candidatus Promineifilum breve TaxID=1806508 RepID=A0A160T4P3_9CHLR|nr:acyl-CoA dehydrogenase family protein [Candidatus Promineifilum breve]CUS04379.2 Acyl-CoA dehydrogenase domain protein [Candidatus Promineifilum breve]